MVGAPHRAAVALLTRAPTRGGKRRLFAQLRRDPDSRLLWALLLDTLDALLDSGLEPTVFVEPGDACAEVSAGLPPGIAVRPQADGSLGDRMRAALDALLAGGARAAVVVGSDLPELTGVVVAEAAASAVADPGTVVLGPAVDGGYYLLASTTVPDLFDDVAWGEATVLDETLARARSRAIAVAFGPQLHDVDEVADLRRVAGARPGSRTAAWFRSADL